MNNSLSQSENLDKIDWNGGNIPLNASYGKMMMWFFIISDALTFTGFLVSYGFSRFKFIDAWPIPDQVFNHFPFLHGVEAPMYYVALMTLILILSSVTMVLAVDAGHNMNKAKVTFYMLLTIIGGIFFVGSQAWEWGVFIKGEYGALETKSGQILQFIDKDTEKRVSLESFAVLSSDSRHVAEETSGLWFVSAPKEPTISLDAVKEGFLSHPNIVIRSQISNAEGRKIVLSRGESIEKVANSIRVVEGANLIRNEYGNPLFADFFFFITGFHGFHVFSGIVINVIIFFNVILGTYQKRGHYEMVEKVGLYWHFVDLVWVFVFTFFYLV